MKRLILILACAAACIAPAAAQQRMFRSEFIPYDTREAAVDRNREADERFIPLLPDKVVDIGGVKAIHAKLQVPPSWRGTDVFIHLENVGAAYTLNVNGQTAAQAEDAFTPSEFRITPFVDAGANEVLIILRGSNHPQLQQDLRSDGQFHPLE